MTSSAARERKPIGRSSSGSHLAQSIDHRSLGTGQLASQPSQLIKRSQSLSSLRAELRRAAGGLDRFRHRRSFCFRGPAILKAFCLATACVAGLFFGGAGEYFDITRSRRLSGGPTAVIDAFEASSSRLETLRHVDGGKIPLVDFLDALEVLSPAYDSLGLMFSVASREMTSNVKKLRREFKSQLSVRQREQGDGGDQNQSITSSLVATTTVQSLVLGGPSGSCPKLLVPSPLLKATSSSSQHNGGGTDARHPLVSKEAFEAALWLTFALHFMELLYGCIGSGGTEGPAACTERAYGAALKDHQGPAMRAVAKHLMRIIPATQGALRNRIGFDDDNAPGFEQMMGRWAKAVSRHRKALEKFFALWPPHTG